MSTNQEQNVISKKKKEVSEKGKEKHIRLSENLRKNLQRRKQKG